MFGKLNNRLCYQPCLLDVFMYRDVHRPDTKTCVCVKMLPAGNTYICNGTPVSCASKTPLFIHFFVLNLNSASFGCPSSFSCNSSQAANASCPHWNKTLTRLMLWELLLRGEFTMDLGWHKANFQGSSTDASYLYFLLAHCNGSGVGFFSVSMCGPLHVCVSSSGGDSFLGAHLARWHLPGVRSVLAGLRWAACPLLAFIRALCGVCCCSIGRPNKV